MVKEYLSSKKISDAVNGVREMRAPKHFLPEILSKIIVCSLDSSDDDKEHVSSLFHALRTEGLIAGENFMQVGFYKHLITHSLPTSMLVSRINKGAVLCVCVYDHRLSLTCWTSALSLRVTFPW